MNYSPERPERHDLDPAPVETPPSVAHLVHTLQAYKPVILIALLSVAIGYAVCAILLYILSPAQRTTVQPFRLEFRGANEGTLPNGVRFSPTEIVSTPVLLKVYASDELSRFVNFEAFSRSIYVVESNPAYEKLVADYQSRLSDPKLSPTDRDRLQKEFELKRESISKSDYALGYATNANTTTVPAAVVRKVLVDILNTWAAFAVNEQHALDYRVPVLSPQILNEDDLDTSDPVMSIEILRTKIYRVIANIDDVASLPSAELVKTSDKMSLAEIRMHLEDLVRFRLEPLVGVARGSGLVRNPAVTIHFLENQLSYDQRRLQEVQQRADSLRDALAMYNAPQASRPEGQQNAAAGELPRRTTGAGASGESETVMPQISDTFLDRLVALTHQAADAQYRQTLVEGYRTAVLTAIPIATSVNYDKQVLDEVRGGGAGAATKTDEAALRAEIGRSAAEARDLIGKVNEIYRLLVRNTNPATQLFSLAGPVTSRIERARTLPRLMLYGVLLLLISLPVVVALCLIHNRVREDEAAEQRASAHPPVGEPA